MVIYLLGTCSVSGAELVPGTTEVIRLWALDGTCWMLSPVKHIWIKYAIVHRHGEFSGSRTPDEIFQRTLYLRNSSCTMHLRISVNLNFNFPRRLLQTHKCEITGTLPPQGVNTGGVEWFHSLFSSDDCSKQKMPDFIILIVVVQLLSHVQLFVTPWTAACQASLSFTISWSLLKLMSIELVMLSNHLILCCPLFLLPSIFSSIRVFSNESALHSGGQSIGASASASVLPINIQGWFPLGLTGLISLLSKELSRVFSRTTIQTHHFFSVQSSLWSNSHIHTWLMEKPYLWLYRPLSPKWCLCFLIYTI